MLEEVGAYIENMIIYKTIIPFFRRIMSLEKKGEGKMLIPLSVKDKSIETSGITKDYRNAISEFIWNGFEANASCVSIDYVENSAFGIDVLTICDNGEGICYEQLNDTFGSFLASNKNGLASSAKTKANKGKGRFSFTAFSQKAIWHSVYLKDGELNEFDITIYSDKKDQAECSPCCKTDGKHTGTTVTFYDVYGLTTENMDFNNLEHELLQNFAWYLYLFRSKRLSIKIREKELDYQKHIDTAFSITVREKIEDYFFDITIIVWKTSIKEKFCCYYFNNQNEYRYKDTTLFNRNTVSFCHSVYVKSDFFDELGEIPDDDDQISLFDNDAKNVLRKLRSKIKKLIEKQMSAFLSVKSEQAIDRMINERKTFPKHSDDPYGKMKSKVLREVTIALYKLEPRVFYKLSPIQEKSLLAMLDLLLDSEERENILFIIEKIVDLTPEQRTDFSNILKKTELENLIETIKFVENRFKVIELLRKLIYEMPDYANERDHIQKIIENHFWLFGEQYTLVSADKRMQKTLESYTHLLYGKSAEKVVLEPDLENERRMDIFLSRIRSVETGFNTVTEENLIVELKAPNKKLTLQVLRQIEDYMEYVRRQPQFNSSYRKWKFIAVCRELDDAVAGRYEAFKEKGKVGLVSMVSNYEVYALTWDDIFRGFDLVNKPILERLKYDREMLSQELLDGISMQEGREKANAITETIVGMSLSS